MCVCCEGQEIATAHRVPACAHLAVLLHCSQNISTASWLYGSNGSKLSYVEGDAHGLDRDPAAVALAPNVIFCIEAAFHFDRPAFLASAARVLAPGGRLVVVDFAWNNEAVASGAHLYRVRACNPSGDSQACSVWFYDPAVLCYHCLCFSTAAPQALMC